MLCINCAKFSPKLYWLYDEYILSIVLSNFVVFFSIPYDFVIISLNYRQIVYLCLEIAKNYTNIDKISNFSMIERMMI